MIFYRINLKMKIVVVNLHEGKIDRKISLVSQRDSLREKERKKRVFFFKERSLEIGKE